MDCSGRYSCRYETKVCSTSCRLQCGYDSCDSLDVTCPDGESCMAICSDYSACGHTVFRGDWTIKCTGRDACYYLIESFRGNWNLDCSGKDACNGLSEGNKIYISQLLDLPCLNYKYNERVI